MLNYKRIVSSVVVTFVFACMFSAVVFAKEITPKVTIRVDGAGQDTVELAVNLLHGEYMRVELTAASGTGYEWKLVEDPRLTRITEKSEPVQLSDDKNRPGGQYRITYTLQAGAESGNESIRFILVRSWETNKLASKTLMVDMTVTRR